LTHYYRWLKTLGFLFCNFSQGNLVGGTWSAKDFGQQRTLVSKGNMAVSNAGTWSAKESVAEVGQQGNSGQQRNLVSKESWGLECSNHNGVSLIHAIIKEGPEGGTQSQSQFPV